MSDVRLTIPSVGAEELAEIQTVLAGGWLTQGPAVAAFENMVADHVGVRHALAVTSATTALHLALAALDVGPGDDVIVPAFTFPATANVVVQQGAQPVFADIDPLTFAITPATVEAAATPSTVAVIPVDPFGYPADMAGILGLADDRGWRVVEDAACAIGAQRDGIACGAFRDVGCFSFHPRKIITTGEGGMLTTDDDGLADRLGLLRNHGGRRIEGRYHYEAAGFNYRMSDIQAAMGVAQMRKLPGILERRRALASHMSSRLADIPGIRLPVTEPSAEPTYQSYVIMLPTAEGREDTITALRDLGIESTIGTYGLHLEPYFGRTVGTRSSDLPNATEAALRSLTLPLYPSMAEADIDRVAESLAVALRGVG